jgi:hypothetical protein
MEMFCVHCYDSNLFLLLCVVRLRSIKIDDSMIMKTNCRKDGGTTGRFIVMFLMTQFIFYL